jgi:hypothetical protein
LETEPTRMCALLATSPRPVPFHQHRKGGLTTAIEECLVGIQRARGRQAEARHRRPGELYGRLGAGGNEDAVDNDALVDAMVASYVSGRG